MMTGFYARFIPYFFKRAVRLHSLKWKEAKFIWTQEYHSAFESLKQALSETPNL